MDKAWTIATLFHVVLLSVACVQGKKPKLFPLSCAHLQPKPCTKVHSKDAKGDFDSEYYYERCVYHDCKSIAGFKDPGPDPAMKNCTGVAECVAELGNEVYDQFYNVYSPSPKDLWNPTAARPQNSSKTRITQRDTEEASVARLWDPALFAVDSQGRFIRRADYWFCNDQIVNYYARVERDTGHVAGQKEDMFVHCEWLRFKSFLDLTNCPKQTYPCYNCLQVYRNFLCGVYFPQCRTANTSRRARGLKPEGEVDGVLYAYPEISDLVNAEYTVVKPCRGLCYDVARRCTYFVNIKCHRYESRDWGDWPYCNNAGSQNVTTMRF